MSGASPEEPLRLPLMEQGWRSVSFLHWAYDPGLVAPLLPKGLSLDTFSGRAWVSITPFLVTHAGPPRMRWLATGPFPETNLRTYVRGPDGSDGVLFLSLDASSVVTVLGARAAYWVPYHLASMRVEEGATIRYLSQRRAPGTSAARHEIVVRPGEPLASRADELAHWLTGRWRAWTRIAGQIVSTPIRHAPWPLHRAELVSLDETLTRAAGLPEPSEEPLVHYSPGVAQVCPNSCVGGRSFNGRSGPCPGPGSRWWL